MSTSVARFYIQFNGFLSTLFGVFFVGVGLLGLIFAVGGLASPPILRSGTAIASVQSSSTGHYAIRAKLDDGRQVIVAQESSPIDEGVRLRLVVTNGNYEIYDPTGPWVGSLVSITAGIGIYLVGRVMKDAWKRAV
jgi:hypothetical protein